MHPAQEVVAHKLADACLAAQEATGADIVAAGIVVNGESCTVAMAWGLPNTEPLGEYIRKAARGEDDTELTLA